MRRLFVLLDAATGALISESLEAPAVAAGQELVTVDDPPYPRAWDPELRVFEPAPFTTVLHAAYDEATGRLLSESSRPIDPLFVRAGVGLAAFEAAQVPVRHQWDAATRTYVERPLLSRTRLTLQEFWRRFTRAERIAIQQYRSTTTNDAVRAELEAIEADLRNGGTVDVTDPEVIAHVTFLVNGLAQVGVITSGQRVARGTAILAPAAGEE